MYEDNLLDTERFGNPDDLVKGDDVEAALENGTLQVVGTGTPFLCTLINPNDKA
jgi:hypothetical protein